MIVSYLKSEFGVSQLVPSNGFVLSEKSIKMRL